jgi:uncharacterized alpha-E superfamily protein
MGRRLERGVNLVANVRAMLLTDPNTTALAPLLEYTDSTMTYRRRYLARPELPTTLALLITDESNPRSLAFQFRALGRHIKELPGAGEAKPEEIQFEELDALLTSTDIRELACDGEYSRRRLETALKDLEEGCWELSNLLSASYFSHVPSRVS